MPKDSYKNYPNRHISAVLHIKAVSVNKDESQYLDALRQYARKSIAKIENKWENTTSRSSAHNINNQKAYSEI